MARDIIRQWANFLAAVATLVVNILANALPLNGQNTGEISDFFDIYFVPAGYVFAIWGVIYIGFMAFAVYQLLPAQRENPRLRSIGYWFVLASLGNIAWLFLWHYNIFEWTWVAMLVLLISLIMIYLRLDISRAKPPTIERWAVDIPFSIYLGWISVATIANVTQVLYYLQWSGFGLPPEIWAMIMFYVGVLLAGLFAWRRGDIAYLLVLLWSYIGIGVEQAGTRAVAISAWVAVILLVVIILVAIYRKIPVEKAMPA